MNGDDAPLGQLWVSNFLQRNPRVHSIVGRSIDAVRAKAADPQLIRAFLELFEQTQQRQVYNLRTYGIWMRLVSRWVYVITPRCSRQLISEGLRSISRESRVGLYCRGCICRWAETAPSSDIQGTEPQTTWFPSISVPDWFYTTSENGWTSNNVGLEWLSRVFIPESTPTYGADRLLILDGHGSHVSTEFMWTCYQHRIHCLYLPAHSSHVLQPLDLAPFSVVKSKYRDQRRALSALNDAAPAKKERFILSYYQARMRGLSKPIYRLVGVLQASVRTTQSSYSHHHKYRLGQ